MLKELKEKKNTETEKLNTSMKELETLYEKKKEELESNYQTQEKN